MHGLCQSFQACTFLYLKLNAPQAYQTNAVLEKFMQGSVGCQKVFRVLPALVDKYSGLEDFDKECT